MRIVGVVAEYNPFHNGHKYQLEQTRKNGATHIVVVMSGDAVQRGDIACFSKYDRAAAAVENGADLVIELPAPYSCSTAEIFAANAVGLLGCLGENVVNDISFGCESCDTKKLLQTADVCTKLKNSEPFRNCISSGMSYPKAMQQCAEKYDNSISDILSQPNNVLAVEYLRAVQNTAPWIKPMPIMRKAAGHNSQTPIGEYISATALREKLKNGEGCSYYLPYTFTDTPTFSEYADRFFLYRLISADRQTVSMLPDCNENILNRYFSVVDSCPATAAEFIERLKSRNITLARIRRMVLHLALGITADVMKVSVPYGRILAFNERGTQILAAADNRTLSYDTSLSRLETDERSRRVSFIERNAVKLRELSTNGNCECHNEYKRKIMITNGGKSDDKT